jgi:hypothetical protein
MKGGNWAIVPGCNKEMKEYVERGYGYKETECPTLRLKVNKR